MPKRAFDLVASVSVLLLLLPILFLIGVLVKLEDGGPIFYRGVRVGRYGRSFRIFKFRTMVVDAEKLGGTSTADDDPRITRIGKLLRKYKLDELPQLINVLKGEMSLVGPRPQVQWAVDLYMPEEQALMSVRPGITDYASLQFRKEGELLRGSTDPDQEYLEKIAPQKIRLGLEYVHHHNVAIDLKIILATMGALIGVDPSWCLPRREGMHERRGLVRERKNKVAL